MELGSTANIPFNGINILYALGEAQYSGRKFKSNVILYVSLKG